MDTIDAPSLRDTTVFGTYTPIESPGVRPVEPIVWPGWQRVLFRFFGVYLVLQIQPWNWFGVIPGVGSVVRAYSRLERSAVIYTNAHFFHVRDVLVPVNGSGDTSFAWSQMWMLSSVAAIACLVWSVLDRKRPNYRRLAFWFRMSLRYYVASAALSYGIIKLFALQMPFPTLSNLATPLGDLLPMRFSWLFIGYSFPYQFFSGLMETTAGLLLLYRRTITAGLFAATGAFTNVVMINMAYDVPVKLYASHLLFSCLVLLAMDAPRLVNLLVLNRPTPATDAWDLAYNTTWQKWGARAVKVMLLYLFLYAPFVSSYQRFQISRRPAVSGPFRTGIYEVRSFVSKQPVADSIRWRDVIIDGPGGGSIGTKDQFFWQRYGRGYFRYKLDPKTQTGTVWKNSFVPRDSTFLFTMRYELPDTSTIRWHALIAGDSVHVEMVRAPRHFQLTERQFHLVSEYNR